MYMMWNFTRQTFKYNSSNVLGEMWFKLTIQTHNIHDLRQRWTLRKERLETYVIINTNTIIITQNLYWHRAFSKAFRRTVLWNWISKLSNYKLVCLLDQLSLSTQHHWRAEVLTAIKWTLSCSYFSGVGERGCPFLYFIFLNQRLDPWSGDPNDS